MGTLAALDINVTFTLDPSFPEGLVAVPSILRGSARAGLRTATCQSSTPKE